MRRIISCIATDIVAKRLQCGGLALKAGMVILGSLVGMWMMPNQAAIGQIRTFYGVRVSPKFSIDSDLADWIKKSTIKEYAKKNMVKVYRLGEWLALPGTEDEYTTYDLVIFELIKPTKRDHSITLMTGTTSDSPKIFSFSVNCAANKLGLSSYYAFSPSGETIGKQNNINKPPLVPPNEFLQSLVNGVCRLGN